MTSEAKKKALEAIMAMAAGDGFEKLKGSLSPKDEEAKAMAEDMPAEGEEPTDEPSEEPAEEPMKAEEAPAPEKKKPAAKEEDEDVRPLWMRRK